MSEQNLYEVFRWNGKRWKVKTVQGRFAFLESVDEPKMHTQIELTVLYRLLKL